MDPISRIEARLESLSDKQAEMNSEIKVYNVQLTEHMRRTDLIEKRLDSIWNRALLGISIISAILVLLKHVNDLAS
jgi:uncharacterized coiled-coil protein SlyX